MGAIGKKQKILIVDDAQDTLEVIRRNLVSKGYEIHTAQSVNQAIEVMNNIRIDLVITDLKMPGVGGIELVRFVEENYKDTEIMVITGYASIESAVKAVKIGAEDYLAKPFTDEELFLSVRQALEKLSMRRKVNNLKADYTPLNGIIGNSEIMLNVLNNVRKAAMTQATVIITGESGTGKELIARAIHYNSQRSSSPFVPVNCGAIPEELLESELFGYMKGAFTGAKETRAGFFQTADGGTIFLDEIAETSLSMQVKLLRVLQDKEIYMVGSRVPRKVDIRIIAATNKDLLKLVKKEMFREDLFYRLNVISIELPALKERGDDLLLLINFFVKKYSKEAGKESIVISDNALTILKEYSWPGNVRELENIIQRLVVMTDTDKIEVTDLPIHMRYCLEFKSSCEKTLKEVEREYILNVLSTTNNNKTKASRILGIDRKTLKEKLKEIDENKID
ncbi:MAG: sigma-54-dependent Fis family transcriptional regulator [Candidatus Coatesbacteria bacterium]|nr:sigma-54-dependent Fis family transcriptional regulator [Candidatus Coatesbacteria bacterium]